MFNEKIEMSKVWLIDSGHGGVIKGNYVTAPDKMFEHSPEEIFYEGVFNRIIKQKLLERLWDIGINAIDLCPTELDLPLQARADIANIYYERYRNSVGISLHSNAGGGRGFEIWTSPGETDSDKYAEILGEILIERFTLPFRKDAATGAIDKESLFYILTQTQCPFILPECLFFDNYEDYKLLNDPYFRERYVEALVSFIQKSELAFA